MRLAELLVSIGLEAKGLRKMNQQLGETQRGFRRAFGNIQKSVKAFGSNMTKMVTMPLAGLAVGAVKASADLEKLEVSFISLTGGAKNAAAMMSNLNDFTAKTPFQIEGVANAARQLIASGSGINEVNDQLQFLGDIAATSGNGIEEIAAIFSKVNAKGKVGLENLNQLAERGIPIFDALAEATGLPASELGAGAVSVETFNEVLSTFAKEGGFAEGAMLRLSETAHGKLSTALDNLKMAGAAMAESLMPTIKDVIDGVTSIAKRFTAMDEGTKKTVLTIVAVTAAIGPLIMALSALGPVVWAASGPIGLIVLAIGAVVTALFYFRQEIADAIVPAINRFIDLYNEVEGVRIAVEFIAVAARTTKRLFLMQVRSMISYVGMLGKAMYALFVEWDYDKAKNVIVDGLSGIGEDIVQTGIEIGEDFAGAVERGSKGHMEHVDPVDLGFDFASLLNFGDGGAVDAEVPVNVVPETKPIVPGGLAAGTAAAAVGVGAVNKEVATSVDLANNAASAFNALGEAIAGIATGTVTAGQFMASMLTQLADMLGQIGTQFIAAGVAAMQFYANLIANPAAAVAAGVGLVVASKLIGALGSRLAAEPPALATGGLAFGPTLATVGDNPNARVNPEVIAPLDKLKSMMGGDRVTVTGRLDGRDILISSERAGFDRNRVRGF